MMGGGGGMTPFGKTNVILTNAHAERTTVIRTCGSSPLKWRNSCSVAPSAQPFVFVHLSPPPPRSLSALVSRIGKGFLLRFHDKLYKVFYFVPCPFLSLSSTTLDLSTCAPVYYSLFSISSRPYILLLLGLNCLHNLDPPTYSVTGSGSQ